MLTSSQVVANSVDTTPIEPQDFINLVSILYAYLEVDLHTGKPFLVKDGVKIIL